MDPLRIAAAFATAALVTVTGAGAASFAAPPEPMADDAGAATCVKWHGEARFNGSGYRHVVVIENGCKKIAVCAVSTDVNPTVQTVSVAPNAKEEVVTFFDSPVSAFVPNVSCKLQ